MGCGESKHAVATQNTVVKNPSKRSDSIKKNSLDQTSTPVAVDQKKGANVDGKTDVVVVKDSNDGNVKENVVIPDNKVIKEEEVIKADKGKETEPAELKKEEIIEAKKDKKIEEKVKENEVVVEGKEINGEEAKSKPEIKEEAPTKADEDKAAVVPSDETKISATTVEEKAPAVEEKIASAPSENAAEAV